MTHWERSGYEDSQLHFFWEHIQVLALQSIYSVGNMPRWEETILIYAYKHLHLIQKLPERLTHTILLIAQQTRVDCCINEKNAGNWLTTDGK